MQRQEDRAPEQSSRLDSTSVAVGTERRAQAASEQPVTRLSALPPQTGGGKSALPNCFTSSEQQCKNTDKMDTHLLKKKESVGARVKANYCEFHLKRKRPQVQKCKSNHVASYIQNCAQIDQSQRAEAHKTGQRRSFFKETKQSTFQAPPSAEQIAPRRCVQRCAPSYAAAPCVTARGRSQTCLTARCVLPP